MREYGDFRRVIDNYVKQWLMRVAPDLRRVHLFLKVNDVLKGRDFLRIRRKSFTASLNRYLLKTHVRFTYSSEGFRIMNVVESYGDFFSLPCMRSYLSSYLDGLERVHIFGCPLVRERLYDVIVEVSEEEGFDVVVESFNVRESLEIAEASCFGDFMKEVLETISPEVYVFKCSGHYVYVPKYVYLASKVIGELLGVNQPEPDKVIKRELIPEYLSRRMREITEKYVREVRERYSLITCSHLTDDRAFMVRRDLVGFINMVGTTVL